MTIEADPAVASAGKQGVVVSEARPLMFSGGAVDLEDGPINDASRYVWRSDRDGQLGQGPWIVIRKLSPGKHEISLTVHDDSKSKATATRTVLVRELMKQ